MNRLLERIHRHATTRPDSLLAEGKTASGQRVTYSAAGFWSAIEAFGARLQSHRVRHVILAGDNSPNWLIVELAAWKLDIPVTPVPPFFSDEQITHVLATTGADAVISIGAPLYAQLTPEWRQTVSTLQDEPVYVRSTSRQPAPLPPATGLITFTSGTTAAPKGVCLSIDHLVGVIEAIDERLEGIPLLTHGTLLPFAVLLENLAGALFCLWRGDVVYADALSQVGMAGSGGIDPAQWQRWLQYRHPHSLILVPELLDALTTLLAAYVGKSPAWQKQLTLVAVGGGYVARDILHKAAQLKLPVAQGYGLSELGSVVCLTTPEDEQLGQVGKPLHGRSIVTDDEGQLLIYGPRMIGYLLPSGCASEVDDAGTSEVTGPWVSGDLGRQDKQGNWYISGREKETIILSSGRNVAPAWIEAELARLPGIQRAYVNGDAMPGLVALLVTDESGPALIEDAINNLNATLPDYARIRGWLFLTMTSSAPLSRESGEVTANGRLRRDAIMAKRQAELSLLATRTFPRDEPRSGPKAAVIESYPVKPESITGT